MDRSVIGRSAELPWQSSLQSELGAFMLPAKATAEWARQSFGLGVVDPKSMAGLSKLRRLNPVDWHLLVWNLTRLHRITARSTVSVLLTSDAFKDQGMPRRADDFGRLKRYRASARRLDARVGGLPASEVDEPLLDRLGREWVSGPDALAAETVRRDLALLRWLVLRWAEAGRRLPAVHRHPRGPCRRQGRRAPRATPDPATVLLVLKELGSEHRVAAALAGGAGLGEQEALGLRVRHLDLERGWVVVRTGRTRGRPGAKILRQEPIAAWALAVLVLELEWTLGADERQFLFPNRKDPTRPRSDLNRGFARASRVALGVDADPVTIGSLRRLWQCVLRQGRVARAAIRQSYSLGWMERGSRRPPWRPRQRRLLKTWTHLLAPPVELGLAPRLPRKAPHGCGPYQPERPRPERDARAQRVLPESCREDPSEPRALQSAVLPPERTTTSSNAAATPAEAAVHRRDQRHQGDRADEQAGAIPVLDEAAVRRVVRAEVEAALGPVLQRMETVTSSMGDQVSKAAFAAGAAGNLSSWALTHPEQVQEWVERLASVIGPAVEMPDPE
jgi:hypothetical protein